MSTKISALFALTAIIVLSSLTGCVTTTRTPWGSSYTYNGQTTYRPAPEAPAYHHSESGPGYYCQVFSTGTGANMSFSRNCYPNR